MAEMRFSQVLWGMAFGNLATWTSWWLQGIPDYPLSNLAATALILFAMAAAVGVYEGWKR